MKHICYDEIIQLEAGNHGAPINLLVIGTFNPILQDNVAEWFYGREINEFWFLFPKMLGDKSLHPADINVDENSVELSKEFCRSRNIIIVDIIKEVKFNLKGFADREINNIENGLKDGIVIPFEYEKAFKFNKPKLVMFSWKEESGKNIRPLKRKLKAYLEKEHIPYFEVPSGSPMYRLGRKAKLLEWKAAYNSIT